MPLEWRLYEAGFCTHPEAATYRGGSFAPCEYPALVACLRHPVHGVLLFDTGYSRHFFRATSRFPECLYRRVTPVHLDADGALATQLARDGVAAEDVAWVFLSHLHGDHVGGVGDFTGARIALARSAWNDMQSRSRFGALTRGLLPGLIDARAQARLHWFEDAARIELPEPFTAFGHGFDMLGDRSVLLVELPGHAPGHYGLLFEDAYGPVFLVADASWSSEAIALNNPPPSLVTAWLGDTAVYRDTLAKLHALQRDAPQVRIVPAHCRQWRPAARFCSDA